MKAIIYFSLSKKQSCRNIANQFEGDHFEIVNLHKPFKLGLFNMIYYGYLTSAKKEVEFQSPTIDFDKYDEIVLVSPIWAGKVCPFMSQYLKKNLFQNKKVIIVSSSLGQNKNYFKNYDGLLEESNKIIEYITYIKGIKTDERKV